MATRFRRIEEENKRVDIIIDNQNLPDFLENTICKFVCFHNKYNIGHKNHGFFSPESLADYFNQNKDNLFIQPLYILQADTIQLSTKKFDKEYNDVSCLIGFVYMDKETAKKENIECGSDIINIIEFEVENYQNYLNNSNFMYKTYILKDKWELIEENYGYKTSDFEGNGLFKAAGLV